MKKELLFLILFSIQFVQSQLTSNGLILNLDASSSNSYSGSGATWNDISGNNNHFNINTATYNSEGYFVFDGDDSMTGPPSNSFGLSQTDHTIEIILEPTAGGGSVINFRGDSHYYGINAHLPWSSNVIYYDVGGCCESDDRIQGGPNIVGQKTHVMLRSKPTGDSKREVFVNGSSVINSGSSNTSTNTFSSDEATIGGYIFFNGDSHHIKSKIYSVRVYNRALTDQEISNNYNHYLHPVSTITRAQISLDNSTVSVTFSDTVYGGSANATSTLDVSDFSLTISGGSASLTSATPSSINVSGTTIGLGVPLTGTPNGNEILTISPVNNSIFSVSGDTVSSTQSSNTVQLISNIATSGLVLYLDATNENSYSGSGSTWHDLSPNQNDGIISGTTFNSNGGEGFIFGGSSSDYITVADDTSLDMDNNQMTISYQITPDLNGSNWSPVIQKGVSATDCGAGTLNYYTWYGNNDLKIDFEGNSDLRGQLYNATSDDISNGKKIMITITIDQSNAVKTFINGELKHLLNHSGQVLGPATNGPLVIGYCPDPSGKISSIMVYDRALTSQEVFQNYDALNDVPPTNISLTSNTISETASIGSLIGTLSATDSDTSINNLSFSFESSGDTQDDDNVSFTISGTSLLLSTTLDYETKTSYNIYVKVSDGTNDYAKAFTVSVTNVLEPITDLGFHISKAYKFNGTNNYIEVPYVAENHPSNFTIELWARLDQDTGTFQSPLSSRYGSAPWNNLSGYNFYAVNGLEKWSFTVGSGAWESINTTSSTNGEIYDGNTLKFGIWTHLASTYDGTTYRFYVNGVLAGSKTAGYSRVGFNSIPQRPLRIGAGRTEGSAIYFFNGAVDEVRIWNYARTQNEINNNKNAVLSGQETGLVSYYSFDNGNASNDTGVSARDGTLYNSPAVITRNTPYEANIDEESALGTIVRTLTATDSDTTDFTFSLVSGNGTNDQHNSLFTVSGTQLLVAGNIDYETNSTLNIYVQASDGANTYAKALTVNVNDINEPPVITVTSLSNDNSSISVTFSEAVNASADASNTLALEVSDFALSINGGTATLSSTTPSSISVNGNTFSLGLPLSGTPDGNETVTVVPVQGSIYDTGAATASTTQSNNTVSLHGDSDSDGVNDAIDQCPNTPGGASVDVNGCAESQKDPDNDRITGMNDNCPNTANGNQTDTDGDGIGDACDPDIDDDGIANGLDNCPYDYNPNQKDSDTDGMGDLCDADNDNDGFSDAADSFPFDPTEWLDTDRDGIGNNADTDDDNDTYIDTEDAFPLDKKEWLDTDGDGIGNNKDKDDDNDGVEDKKDAFPLDDTENLDTDKDGIGNNADEDDDGDGYSDLDEIACESDPLKRSSRPEDYDRDLSPDCIDTDDDNDDCLDQEDLFPFNERECIDTDGDGIGDNADMDADNDGIIDSLDDFPLDPNESKDTDGDGIGDNADLDDNNDGFPEDPITNSAGEEVIPIFVSELLTPNQPGEESVWRIVNIDKYPSANVKVYSPSGIIVFESWNYQNDWNGTNEDGKPLPTGPYFYRIDRGNETTVEEGWLYIFN